MTARPRLRKWFAVVKFVLPEPKVPRSAQVCSSQQVCVVHQRRYKPAARLTRAIAQRSAHNATTVRSMHARCTLHLHLHSAPAKRAPSSCSESQLSLLQTIITLINLRFQLYGIENCFTILKLISSCSLNINLYVRLGEVNKTGIFWIVFYN